MKRILFLVNHDIVIYNFRKELVERLLQGDYEVYISSPYGERIDNLVAMGCEYINTPIDRHGTSIFQDFKLLLHYKKIIKEIKPDVVLTYTIKPNIYGGMASKSLRIPYIANITGLGTTVENGGIIQKFTTMLYKIAFKKVECVFFQNTENKQFFEDNNIAIKRYRLIPGSGVNIEHFNLLEYPSDDTIELVFISRIMKQKGIDEYLQAAEYIRSIYPNTKFHICGFCEENYEDILKEMQDRDILIYHGMHRDVRDILKITHCIIHPTYHEGMSNVLLEAAATGRPILASNIPGCKEIFDEGISGFGFEAKNVESLIQAIIKFIKLSNEERKTMGKEGRKKVVKEFDRSIVVEAYMHEINEILGKN